MAAVAAATAVAFTLGHFVPALSPSIVAVILGALVTNLHLHHRVLHPGTKLAGKRLLRCAVVLLGLQLSLPELAKLGGRGLAVVLATVAITFVGTQLLARWLGVSPARGLLVATGFSICGASAVAAMEPVAGGDEEDTGVAVALVTLCGSLAILVLPLLRGPLGLDVTDFGSWVGASVHDVGQTVATAQRVPGALTTAVVVKLTRVVLLAPLVAAVTLTARRRRSHVRACTAGTAGTAYARGAASTACTAGTAYARGTASTAGTACAANTAGVSAVRSEPQPQPRAPRMPPPVPLFVAGFLVAIALTSTGWLPAAALSVAKSVQSALLVAALFGLGTGIHLPALVRTGGRSLLLGLASWLLVASVAYAGVRVAAM